MDSQTTLSKKIQNRLQSKRVPSFGETVENAFKMSDKWIFRSISKYVRYLLQLLTIFYFILSNHATRT